MSEGNLVFVAGEDGEVMFTTASGDTLDMRGDKVSRTSAHA